MAYLRLAYTHVRKDIQDSYNNAALPEAARNAFGGLLTLFEWFMPVVSSPLRLTVANCFLFLVFVFVQAQDLGCVIRENLPKQIWV